MRQKSGGKCASVKRVLIHTDPYAHLDRDKNDWNRGVWPCRWISCPNVGQPPFVTAYRLCFQLDQPQLLRAHVSADERYELFVDGISAGRGPERGDPDNWFFETYDLELDAGRHVIVARVWSLGTLSPYAQMSVAPGFLFATEGEFIERLGTGLAPWEAKKLEGYVFVDPRPAWGTGANIVLDAQKFSWESELGQGNDWEKAMVGQAGINRRSCVDYPKPDAQIGKYAVALGSHQMVPATLPAMLYQRRLAGVVRFLGNATGSARQIQALPLRAEDHLQCEQADWEQLLQGRGTVKIAPQTSRRAIIDLRNYYCAYPYLVTSGGKGSSVRVYWAEALYVDPQTRIKGNRNEIEGKYFLGVGDTFLPDGGMRRKFQGLWWQAGRYVEVLVQTGQEALSIEDFAIDETRYPLEMESRFEASDPRLGGVVPILLRGLQMCAHETYVDCPYYEQLMYVGDARLEALTSYAISSDDLLPHKALRMFDASRLHNGLTQSRYPSRVRQVIPPFSLWWVAMVHDYATWRGDRGFVASLMNGVRGVLDAFGPWPRSNDLIPSPDGWNFLDWVPGWKSGVPPAGMPGAVNAALNWQMVYVLELAAQLEQWLGEEELCGRNRRLARRIATACDQVFWDQQRGLFADDPEKKFFSEHTQCLAVLSGYLRKNRQQRVTEGLARDQDLRRTTIYFTHYLFEACRVLGRADILFQRLRLWFDLEKQGLLTTFEMPEPSRSDCHGWGAHPLFHYFATILGIRPGSMGFATVTIQPMLGDLQYARGKMVHPQGHIEVEYRLEGGQLRSDVTLPKGLSGEMRWNGQLAALNAGRQELTLAGPSGP